LFQQKFFVETFNSSILTFRWPTAFILKIFFFKIYSEFFLFFDNFFCVKKELFNSQKSPRNILFKTLSIFFLKPTFPKRFPIKLMINENIKKWKGELISFKK